MWSLALWMFVLARAQAVKGRRGPARRAVLVRYSCCVGSTRGHGTHPYCIIVNNLHDYLHDFTYVAALLLDTDSSK
jgi:hypothetical protein